MRSLRSGALLVVAVGAGCGSDAGPGEPIAPVLAIDDAPLADAAPDAVRDAALLADAAPDAVRDAAPVATPPPFDWVGVIGTGQSLALGVSSTVMSTTQPFHNLKLVDNGPNPKYPIDGNPSAKWATAPLVELIRPRVAGTGPGYTDNQYPNDLFGETPHSGMANELSQLWAARGGSSEYVTAHSVVGWSSHCLVDLNKEGGMRAYPASLAEARVWTQLARAAGKTFGYGGIVLTHGECDAGNLAYGAGLFTLWQDYNTDLKAITGQTRDVVLLVSQQSTEGVGHYDNSAVQVWQAGVAHPGQIVCTGPKYQFVYGSDHLHLPAPGYLALGEKYAEVFDQIVNQGVAWQPLQPTAITRAGAVVTIDFHVPNPPLAWDAHLARPHLTKNTVWANGRGFEAKDATGRALAIASVAIQGASVVLTLAAVPSSAVTIAYAITQDGAGLQGGTDLGAHGQLRDSDALIGLDAETIAVHVTQGSAVVTAVAANGFARRAARDAVSAGADLADDTIVSSVDSASQLTLSTPWLGATGTASLAVHHDLHNFAVHFVLTVP
ncbi:MAG TPA: hypothetical protein VFP84_12120 [Kofleriaceae bacterium]|nr:hypothetical protein [Kofleriaceae bacterium]